MLVIKYGTGSAVQQQNYAEIIHTELCRINCAQCRSQKNRADICRNAEQKNAEFKTAARLVD